MSPVNTMRDTSIKRFNPAFIERWEPAFRQLIALHWGRLWPAVVAGDRYQIHQIIYYHFHQVAQQCCCHPHRRFQTHNGMALVMDVYFHLARIHRLNDSALEPQKLHPLKLVASAFPTLIQKVAAFETQDVTGELYKALPKLTHAHDHQVCPQGVDWISKYWTLLDSGCTSNQTQDHSFEVGQFLDTPVLICRTCGSTPLGFDQTDLLGPGYSDELRVLSVCREHIVSMMKVHK
jgi:hypothetical protein